MNAAAQVLLAIAILLAMYVGLVMFVRRITPRTKK